VVGRERAAGREEEGTGRDGEGGGLEQKRRR